MAMRKWFFMLAGIGWAFVTNAGAAAVPLDLSGVRTGPVTVEPAPEAVIVQWADADARTWRAEFSLNPDKPLITSISTGGQALVERAQPIYRCAVGKRRGGWDAFFDLPPSHPEGTRRFHGVFRLQSAQAKTTGDRLELSFAGLRMGIFQGGITYTFYPGSRLIQQAARVTTDEPEVAYYYDAGLRITVDADRRPGGRMESQIAYYDTQGQYRAVAATGPDRQPLAVRYRALAARLPGGSLAVFPAPHQYFFARDFTTNMGYVWQSAWRGAVSVGIRQLPDDNTAYYPWMNAPPATEQRMSVFYLVSPQDTRAALDNVLRYTHGDRFVPLEGFRTVTAHWHFAYTVQAMANGFDWTPPFKPVLKSLGVDAAIIMDFHGDGHPRDLTELRLQELDAYFRACRTQSGPDFLLIPSEEANVHLGGHWALVFPKPVYWFMGRPPGTAFRTPDPKYGPVYRVGDARELLEMVRREKGYMYQTHPRTKGSTGYPDQIRQSEHFVDARYLGAGWKAMPSDLSSPRLGERALKLLDDMNNWGLRKRLLGEVDVFEIDPTHELYAHMNVNYVRLPRLPSFDDYGQVLEAIARGDFFVSTGEILLPQTGITAGPSDTLTVRAAVQYTFPLQIAEVVWGDGSQTHRQILPLDTTREFGRSEFEWKLEAKGWKWARVAVWDVAGNGAFINPVLRDSAF